MGQEASLLLPLEAPIRNTVFFPFLNILPHDKLHRKDPFTYYKSINMGVSNIIPVPIAMALAGAQNPVTVLGLANISQSLNNLCWAACTRMVLNKYHVSSGVKECDLPNFLFNQQKCCDHPLSSDCDRGCNKNDIIKVYNNYKVNCKMSDLSGDLTSDQLADISQIIRDEISDQRPVEICYTIDTDGSHVVIIAGFKKDATGLFLFLVFDPLNDIGCMTIDQLETLDGKGVWTQKWTEFATIP